MRVGCGAPRVFAPRPPAMRRPAVARRAPVAAAPTPPPDSSSDDDPFVARVQLAMPRRSRLVAFTCNECDARTQRKVNPRAWEKGTVFLQCEGCGAWHKVADAAGLIDEVRFPENAPTALAKAREGAALQFDDGETALAPVTPPQSPERAEGGAE